MRVPLLISAGLVAAVAVTGCAPTSSPADDGTLTVVASTNVYGDLASEIGGDLVDVTSIIDNPAQDPHSFEGTATIQLALSKADVVIHNGGGYDDWASTLLAGAGNDTADVLNAADISGYDQSPSTGEFNEHLWYDFATMAKVIDAITDALSTADAASADTFQANAAALTTKLDSLIDREAVLRTRFDGTGVAITEPVPLYLLEAVGLDNVTPAAFSEAIEEGTDVSPAVLADTLALFDSGAASVLVYNEQTTGPETEKVLAAAKAAGSPVVPVTETMPTTDNYIGWMTANLDALETALG